MSGHLNRWCYGPALVAVLGIVGVAHAQPGGTATYTPNGDAAIVKDREAMALFEKGEWEAALATFREADALYHSPVLVLYQARSLEKLGRLIEARRSYASVSEEAVASDAPEPWQKARADAATELASLDAEVPHIVVLVQGATDATVVTVDEQPAAIGAMVTVDPGEHRIVARGADREDVQTIVVRRGESRRRVELDVRAAALTTKPPVVRAGGGGLGALQSLGVALTVIGGASLIAGGVFGGVALANASNARGDLPKTCNADKVCADFDEQRIEARFHPAYTFASAADGLLIGGGIAAAAGVLMLVLAPHKPHPSAMTLGFAF